MAQPGGRELFGASLGVAPQLQPLQGMLLRPSTGICPKDLTRDMRGFFNSLLGQGWKVSPSIDIPVHGMATLAEIQGGRDITGVLLKKEQDMKRRREVYSAPASQAFASCLALPPSSRSPAGRKAGATVQNSAEQSAAIGRLEAALAKDPRSGGQPVKLRTTIAVRMRANAGSVAGPLVRWETHAEKELRWVEDK